MQRRSWFGTSTDRQQRRRATKADRRTSLALEGLESRKVPAAFSLTAGGVFTVNLAEVASRSVNLDTNSLGVLGINGRSSGARPENTVVGAPNGQLKVADIKRIVINGSGDRDLIDLHVVSPSSGFRNPNGNVVINGGGGADTIRGTDYNDEIHAGAGNDRVFGYGGNDRIWGDADADELWGDGDSDQTGGDDRLDGGDGDDTLHGGGGTNLMIGGQGSDTFIGGVGNDTIWIDTADRPPSRGWRWAGIEDARSGNPPRI